MNTNTIVRQIQIPSIMITASMMMIAGDIIVMTMIIKTKMMIITQHINKGRRNSEVERSTDQSEVMKFKSSAKGLPYLAISVDECCGTIPRTDISHTKFTQNIENDKTWLVMDMNSVNIRENGVSWLF